MSKKQIKQIRIEVNSVGAKDAAKELQSLDTAMSSIVKSSSDFANVAGQLGPSLSNLAKSGENLSTAATNLKSIGSSLKSINTATAGTDIQTKKLDGYITNLEVLTSVLGDVALSAERAELGLDGINASAGMKSLVSVLEEIQVNTGKAAGRIKETRDNISQLDVTTGRAGEELEDMSYQARKAAREQAKLAKSTKKTTAAMQQTTKAVGNQTKSFSALAFGANPLVSTYAAIAVNIYAITAAFKLLSDASSFSRLQEQLTSFSAAVTGVDVNNLAVKLREASAGALSLKESLSFATKGVAFSFTTDQLEKLTASTRKASIALGRDFTDSMDRVLRGISKQEIELFDELGIVTRLTPAFQKYAAEVGKTVDELTNYERQLALTNEVQGQLDQKFSGITAGATAWETLGVNAQDATTELLVFISDGLEPAAAKLSEVLDYLGILGELKGISKEATTSADIFSKAISADNIGAAVTATGALSGKVADLKKQLETSKTEALSLSVAMGGFGERLAVSGANVLTEFAGIAGFGFFNEGLKKANIELRAGYSDSARYNNELRLQAAINKEILALEKLRIAQLSELAGREITQPIDASTGTDFIAYIKGLNDAMAKIEGLGLAGQKATGPLVGMLDTLRELTNMPKVVEKGALIDEAIVQQTEKFLEFQKSFKTDASLDNIGKVTDATLKLAEAYARLPTEDRLISINTGARGEEVADLERTIKLRKDIQEQEVLLGKVISKETTTKRVVELEILSAKLAQLKADKALQESLRANNYNTSVLLGLQSEKSTYESESIKIQLDSLNIQLTATDLAKKDNTNLQDQIGLLNLKYGLQLKNEEAQRESNKRTVESAKLTASLETVQSEVQRVDIEQKILDIKRLQVLAGKDGLEKQLSISLLDIEQKKLTADKARAPALDKVTASLPDKARLELDLQLAGSEQKRVEIARKLLELRRAEVMAMAEGIEKSKALALLKVEENTQDKSEAAAPFKDASSTFSAMAGLEGVTELQSASLGLAGTFSDAFAGAAEAGMEGFSGFTEFLSGNMEAFQGFAQGVADGVGSVYQASSDARVAGIDQEIAAEKKRDGKSAESLAKIRSLEKKKIKEQAKAKKASVIISAATAIAMSFAQLGPIAGIPAAAMMAGMGVLQIAAINKAANGQIAGLDSGAGEGSKMKIEGGNRKNDIDVSRNSNAGELSFVNGLAGQGNSSNFNTPGRAGGGTSSAGASIIVGERGAEEITPLVPVSVAPAGSGSSGASMVFSPVFNVEAMDSAGFEAVTSKFSVELFNSLETELRARNLTLDNLA
jgi:hypothetical protein